MHVFQVAALHTNVLRVYFWASRLEAAARAATAKSMPSVVERLIQRNSNVTRIYVSKIEFFIHLMRIISFLGLAVIFYTPLDGHWFNQPVGGWDANRTIDSWGIFLWDWDWIDCVYFAMVTMTTVGYGDNPTLSQGLRIFTIFFACLGVVFVAGSINVIADWFSEQGQKRFIAQQRVWCSRIRTASRQCSRGRARLWARLRRRGRGRHQ
jgi:hypothetical protein